MSDMRIERDDPLKIHHLTETAIPVYVPPGFSPISSLKKAEEGNPAIQRLSPKLEEPRQQHHMIPLIELYEMINETASMQIASCRGATRSEAAEIEESDQKREELLIENAKNNASISTWSAFSTISHYLSSTASIALGLSVGGPIGGLLAFSGGCGMLREAVGMNTITGYLMERVRRKKESLGSSQRASLLSRSGPPSQEGSGP